MSHPYDIAAIRRQFPAAEKITYLDSGFQTPLSTPVKQAIETFLHEGYEFGRAQECLARARGSDAPQDRPLHRRLRR